MKLAALCIIIHPLLILGFTALALSIPEGINGITNPSFHGLSQVLYEFASSAANNGSGFEGLADNSLFWNMSCGIVMFLARYLPIIIQLGIAGSLMNKIDVNKSTGTLENKYYIICNYISGSCVYFLSTNILTCNCIRSNCRVVDIIGGIKMSENKKINS